MTAGRPADPGIGPRGAVAGLDDWRHVAMRLRPFVARRVPPSDVDDVMQEIFVRMHRGLAALRDEDRFTSWLFQIARNAVADHARTRVRHPLRGTPEGIATRGAIGDGAGDGAGDRGGDRNADRDDRDDDRDAARALAGCVSVFVAQLPSPYREAITLVELEGLTARQASEMAGISLSGMKSRVQRGREQLRRLFDQCCEIALDARGKVTDFVPRQPRCPACK